MKPVFKGGADIAIETPHNTYSGTVTFYRDILGLPLIEEHEDSCVFQFGPVHLWIDRVQNISHPDIWFEILADDVQAASGYLGSQGVQRRDEVERLPEDFEGFWISVRQVQFILSQKMKSKKVWITQRDLLLTLTPGFVKS